MTLQEIKTAVDGGKRVCWANPGYEVVHDGCDQWLIRCVGNDSCVGLTKSDGVTMNEKEDRFFVDNRAEPEPLRTLLGLAQRMLQRARLEILEGTRDGGKGVRRGLAMDIAVVQDRIEKEFRNVKWRPRT